MNGILFCEFCGRTFNRERKICPMDGFSLKEIPTNLPEIGDIINRRFVITHKIGSGGMGAIFQAFDTVLKRDVALKVLKPELSYKEDAIRRFFIEARAAKSLNHPYIVVIFDFGCSTEGYLYISMELLEGTTLADEIQRCGKIPLPRIFKISYRISEALQIAHKNGVIHRDLKPENIFLIGWDNEGDFVKVLDFGIAAICNGTQKRTLNEGEIVGTPGYMSPEQIKGKEVDERSDIYSFGVMFYEMLTGKCPFEGDDPYEVMKQHLSKNFPPIDSLSTSISVKYEIENLLKSLLEKDLNLRLPTALALKKKLYDIGVKVVRENNIMIKDEKNFLTPFHSRLTLPVDISPFLFNIQPTFLLSEERKNLDKTLLSLPNSKIPTVVTFKICPYCSYRNKPDRKICDRCERKLDEGEKINKNKEVPWTLSNITNYVFGENKNNFIKLTLLHIKFYFGEKFSDAPITLRELFEPEIEAWAMLLRTRGGFICFDIGNEIRCIFGLGESNYVQSIEALSAAIDLKKRVENFRNRIKEKVSFSAGISTGYVPKGAISFEAIDLSIRGSSIDLAERLSDIGEEDSIILDEFSARYVIRKYKVVSKSNIKVRGISREIKIFTFVQ